ncbi:MAG: prepilin-type N-terminal cleavage/methylation domain-containing protein [Candidatus Aminicenantes bacterium]|nr:MAG: prepilin-type N-terminal cleavage/methylation domain-containing protein [Candidatus Aminicenantes bacterium]
MKNKINESNKPSKEKGFSLIEILIAIALMGFTLLGLAQLFTYSVMNNARSDKMTNATFLAQQQIDFLRNLPAEEFTTLSAAPLDESIDVNNDGRFDFRRITNVQAAGNSWNVRVYVFQGVQGGTAASQLIQNPATYRVRADISTIISR